MKLELQINSRAINDTSRSLEGTGIVITPAIDENFWLFRVAVSDSQALVGFPKFSVIGIGFQHEEDWNTNLPSGTDAIEIYDHIKHNKGDSNIPKHRCLDAIRLIQNAVLRMDRNRVIEALMVTTNDAEKLKLLGRFLRVHGHHEVAMAIDE